MKERVRWWWVVVAGTAGVILGGFVVLKLSSAFFVDGYNITKIAHVRTELVALESLRKGDLSAALKVLEGDLGYNEAYLQVALPDAAKQRSREMRRVLDDVRTYKLRHRVDGK